MIFSNSFAQPTFPPVIYPLSIIASFLLHLLLHKLCFSLSALIWPQYFLIAKYDDEPSTMKHEERVAGVETVGCRSRTDQMEWTSRLVSNFHATVVFLWGMYIFWTTPEFYIEHSFITGDGASFHSALLYCFSNGYFLLDLYMALRYMNDKSSIVHHVVIAFNQLVILFYWKAFIMGISISVTEATTVFVNQRWFFAKSGVYDWRYRLNGVIMFFGFLIFRVTYSGYIIFVTYTNMSVLQQFPIFFIVLYTLSCLAMSSLNLFWFYKIGRGLLKVLTSKGKTGKSLKLTNPGLSSSPSSEIGDATTPGVNHIRRRTRKE